MITDLDNRLIWYNGNIVPAQEAKIYAMAPTAQFGLNVFEGIPVYHNSEKHVSYAFRLEKHFVRLKNSARMLELDNRYSVDDMNNALFSVVKANGGDEDIVARVILFVEGVGSWASEGPVGMLVSPMPRKKISSEYTKHSLKCCFSSWRRISDQVLSPKIKCGANYINSRLGQREALRNGYDTCIFLNDQGKIAEGPGSCFFMVKDNVLITPKVTDSILNSITRDTIIKIAEDNNYEVQERSIDRTEAYICDEAFLCGSSMGITSISRIDGIDVPNHEVTDKISDIYCNAVCGKDEHYQGWLTEIK